MLLAASLLSIDAISFQIAEIPYGHISPDFSVSCLNTIDNQTRITKEVANLYGYFLTYQAHEKNQVKKLQSKGILLEVKDVDDYFPPEEQIQEFVFYLQELMLSDLEKSAQQEIIATKLGVDYSPDPGALLEAFKLAKLDIQCNSLLPYKSLIYLEIIHNQLRLHVWLRGL